LDGLDDASFIIEVTIIEAEIPWCWSLVELAKLPFLSIAHWGFGTGRCGEI